MAAVSAHIGEPFSLLVSSDPGVDAAGLLGAATSMLPEGLLVRFENHGRKSLSADPSFIQGKTIIANGSCLRKVQKELLIQLMTRGSAPGQRTTGLIMRIDQLDPDYANLPSVMLVNLDADRQFVESAMEQRLHGDHDPIEGIKNRILNSEFQRLQPYRVAIPYLGQIMEALNGMDSQAIQNIDLIERLLRIITMINHHAYATPEEMICGFYKLGTPQTNSGNGLLLPGNASGVVGHFLEGELTATKLEYHIFYKVVGDYFTSQDNQLTDRQKRVFEAIKAVNLNYINRRNLFIDPQASQKEILKTLDHPAHFKGWASMSAILEVVNQDGGLLIRTVDREIEGLLEQRLITGKIDANDPDKFRYRVRTLHLAPRTALPHPSAIIDPIYNGAKVTVFNLLTGETETI